jgi:hypothetical protein
VCSQQACCLCPKTGSAYDTRKISQLCSDDLGFAAWIRQCRNASSMNCTLKEQVNGFNNSPS